jgi:hypothetical protein
MTDMATWATERCEAHDMTSCADCLERARMRRTPAGELAWDNDCTVATYTELTGAPYGQAVEAMRAAGYKPGLGLHRDQLAAALRAAGYQVTDVTRRYRAEDLAALSAQGRMFWLSGQKGSRRHSWTVTGGAPRRAYAPPYRFRAYEVTAPGAPAPAAPAPALAAKRSPKGWGNPVWHGHLAAPGASGATTYRMEHADSTSRDRRMIEGIEVTNRLAGPGRGWDLVVHGTPMGRYRHKTDAQHDAEQLLDA